MRKKRICNFKNYVATMVFTLLCVLMMGGVKAEAAAAPAQVTELKQTISTTYSIMVEWKNLFDDVSYQVDISEDGVNWVEDLTEYVEYGNHALFNSSLSAGSTYYVRVRAYDVSWDDVAREYVTTYGPYSQILECVTIPDENPATIRTDAATATSVSLSWDKVEGANAYVIKYKPYDANDESYEKLVVETNQITLKNLTKHTKYSVGVWAARQTSDKKYVVWETKSGLEIFDINTVYLKPSKLKCMELDYMYNNTGAMRFTCSDVTGKEEYQLELWTAYKKKDKKLSTWTSDKSYTTGTIFADTNVIKKYKMIKVRARGVNYLSSGKINGGDWSDWMYLCKQPTIKTKSVKNKGIKVSWQKVDGAEKYYVYMSTNEKAGFKKVASVSGTSKTIKKWKGKALKNNKTYYFKVVPVTKEGKKWKAVDYSSYSAYGCKYKKK